MSCWTSRDTLLPKYRLVKTPPKLKAAATSSAVAPIQIGWCLVKIALLTMSRWISGMITMISVANSEPRRARIRLRGCRQQYPMSRRSQRWCGSADFILLLTSGRSLGGGRLRRVPRPVDLVQGLIELGEVGQQALGITSGGEQVAEPAGVDVVGVAHGFLAGLGQPEPDYAAVFDFGLPLQQAGRDQRVGGARQRGLGDRQPLGQLGRALAAGTDQLQDPVLLRSQPRIHPLHRP